MTETLDLGHGVTLRFYAFAPDRTIAANAERYRDVPDVERHGAIFEHPKGPNGCPCEYRRIDDEDNESGEIVCRGAVTFRSVAQQQLSPDSPSWTVESWEPLTLSPSIACRCCGSHGFVREGRWVPA